MNNDLSVIGRSQKILSDDIKNNSIIVDEEVNKSSFLIIGGAGTIGKAVTKEIFSRNPKKLHVVDISENNMVELVRDLRSSFGYIDGDFKTFAIDCGSCEFEYFFSIEGPYDYVLNLSAMKHVRSEKDPYTLMRMVDVNIINTLKTINLSIEYGAKKYFCVSTDKAANPVNMMGASKRIMELFLMKKSQEIKISTARFANVAFSDGSLLYGFNKRLENRQPIAAPSDVKRYFVTEKEAGEICLLSTILGNNREIFFPRMEDELKLTTFSSIATKFLKSRGYDTQICNTESEARKDIDKVIKEKKWPCYFFKSDTTGEKDIEEFYTDKESVDESRFLNLGVIDNELNFDDSKLEKFLAEIRDMKDVKKWDKDSILRCFYMLLPQFNHMETNKYLDGKM